MKTLILSEATWELMQHALQRSSTGLEVLDRLASEGPALPEPSELVRLARQKAEPPEAFARAVEARDAARQAGEDTRDVVTALIMQAHAAGVGPRMLSRWSGLKETRIYQIIEPARAGA